MMRTNVYAILLAALVVGITIFVQPSKADHSSLFGIVARNLILGDPITVCSDYPNATQTAIGVINSALYIRGDYTEKPVLEFKSASHPLTACPQEKIDPETGISYDDRIASIVILATKYLRMEIDGVNYNCGIGLLACTPVYRSEIQNRDENKYTFVNRVPILIKTEQTDPKSVAFPKSTDFLSASNTLFEGLVTVIAHELGHVLGLAHFGDTESEREKCVGEKPTRSSDVSSCTGPALMFSPADHSTCGVLVFNKNRSGIVTSVKYRRPITNSPDTRLPRDNQTPPDRGTPYAIFTNKDLNAYQRAYQPDVVRGTTSTPVNVRLPSGVAKSIVKSASITPQRGSVGNVEFAWERLIDGIHVEKHFGIFRYTIDPRTGEEGWEELRTSLNEAEGSVTIQNQPSGYRIFAVASVTHAYQTTYDPHGPSVRATVNVGGATAPPTSCALSVDLEPDVAVPEANRSVRETGGCGGRLKVNAPSPTSLYVFTGWGAPCASMGTDRKSVV